MRFLLLVIFGMIWIGARHVWPLRMALVRAENRVIINNSVSSSANGEECEKSEIKEISGEGDISINSQLECVSNVGNAENNEGKADMRSVQVKEKLIKFDRESYRKDVLGIIVGNRHVCSVRGFFLFNCD
ncbi:hypothetical protein A2410_00510 [Candidatus Shapirobacteria bacterium RIFOXYC1_FULL_38_24]|uniref:Uncharacterized protein n=2 Tax=Candidatus Shapironibacteriota TaxID=1752721 RepID=A0A0G0JTZ2_9BACT|nr:MAG: hypothetical protein US90_C0008G0004 [Candidatus Shapirobacteria bacterium GW2011_GWE2_38_30]OGL57971.1 MAG: hypothetical protein A2410_00510 [Candidatus Shapirobacteria bacterium RIFOXYC1_FULL_38_24]HAP37362.1 hypothetical protein [Candidatus Shapirobacteria bacterium]